MKFRIVKRPMALTVTLQVGIPVPGRMGGSYRWDAVGDFPNSTAARNGAIEYKAHWESVNTTFTEFEL